MPTTYAIPNGRTVMDATIWSGDASTPRAITNQYGFQPDFVWVKNRSSDPVHTLWDAVRTVGSNKELSSATTTAEGSLGIYGTTAQYGYVSALNSNGFSVTTGSTSASYVNNSGSNYVGWQWKANGAGSSNTQGSITSTVSVNQTAGFSIVTWTGNGTNGATVGHGLGISPGMIIAKRRDSSSYWPVAHSSLTSGYNLLLPLTNSQASASGFTSGGIGSFNSTTFTCTQGVSDSANINGNGGTYVAYCWAPIAGYSAFGSYTGNGSTDGTFVFTGFRPKFVIIKASSSVSFGNWVMKDTTRNPSNIADANLYANLSNAEDNVSTVNIDILSNGFKLRGTYDGINGNGSTYIYAAFAEVPQKYANAR